MMDLRANLTVTRGVVLMVKKSWIQVRQFLVKTEVLYAAI